MFNKETEYALRGLVYIQLQNSEGRRPGVAEIAEQIDAPHFYTAKILQRMVRQGFIESQKGKGGGFYFDSKKPELSLKQLIMATEGDKLFSGCGFGLNQCDENNPCPLHERYGPIRDALNQLVTEENVQSLAQGTLRGEETHSPRLK
ncbi:MAG: Rrf2 family transcriptional regulator [Bacteroidota bacterium]